MANNCYTTYKIVGPLHVLNKLCDTLFQVQNHPVYKETCHYWGDPWMGDILLYLGYTEEEIKDARHRGGIQSWEFDDEEGVVTMETMTAWGEMYEWRHLVSAKFPELKWYYISTDEFGNFYSTNDSEGRFFDYQYHVDAYVPRDGYCMDFKNIEEAAEYLQEDLGVLATSYEELSQLCDKYNGEHENEDWYIYLKPYIIYND